MSIRTKKELAQALKTLVCEKSFDKISIVDITDKCHVNRQTFYYHFDDKYECLSWIYETECFYHFTTSSTLDSWNRSFVKMLEILKANQVFYIRSIQASSLTFVYPLIALLKQHFENTLENIDIKKNVQKQEEVSLSEFLAYGCTGIILNWVVKGMKEDPHEIAKRLLKIAISVEKLSNQVDLNNKEHMSYSE